MARLLLLFSFILLSCSTANSPHKSPAVSQSGHTPKPTAAPTQAKPESAKRYQSKYLKLDHIFFEVHYDQSIRLARYVKYQLQKKHLRRDPSAKRRERFHADPLLIQLKLPAVTPKDYVKSGYDRGHLAPAGDFEFSQEAIDRTFVMSNMVPQKPGLNRTAWRLLEEQVRRWACGEQHLTVISGPILGSSDSTAPTLPSGLPVPSKFFKIVFDETPPRKAIAFIYRQEDKNNVMKERIVSLIELDHLLNENFAALLEEEARRPAQVSEWKECEI